jgi:hypothetical protein
LIITKTKPASRIEYRESMLFQLFLEERMEEMLFIGKGFEGQHCVAVTIIVQWVYDKIEDAHSHECH